MKDWIEMVLQIIGNWGDACTTSYIKYSGVCRFGTVGLILAGNARPTT
jgi:hypothetical protein